MTTLLGAEVTPDSHARLSGIGPRGSKAAFSRPHCCGDERRKGVLSLAHQRHHEHHDHPERIAERRREEHGSKGDCSLDKKRRDGTTSGISDLSGIVAKRFAIYNPLLSAVSRFISKLVVLGEYWDSPYPFALFSSLLTRIACDPIHCFFPLRNPPNRQRGHRLQAVYRKTASR